MKGYFVNIEKQTIEDAISGRTLFFGIQDFYDKITKGDCCFICGANPDSKPFNDEHVIPNWILRRFNLHNQLINLGNGQRYKYGQYKVPCCVECNTELNDTFEKPLNALFEKPYRDILGTLERQPLLQTLIFRWLCLIYLKTHLKDREFFLEVDRRKQSGYIADTYDWSDLHHIHAMARAHHTGAVIDTKVYGSMLVVPMLRRQQKWEFDYMDHAFAQSVLMQVGEVCLIAVLNDSNAVYSAYAHVTERIAGPLTHFQSREIFARWTHVNLNLAERPVYASGLTDKGYEIHADSIPDKVVIYSGEEERVKLGSLFHHYVVALMPLDKPNQETTLQLIRDDQYSFILNTDHEFIQYRGYEDDR